MFSLIRKKINVLQHIKKFMPAPRYMFLLLGSGVFLLALSYVNPYLYKVLVDNIMTEGNINLLWILILAYIITFSLRALLTVLQKKLRNQITYRTSLNLRKKLLRIYLIMSTPAFKKHNTGDLYNRLYQDTQFIQDFPVEQVVNYLLSCLNILITAVILVVTDWRLALFGFALIPLSFWLTQFIGKRLQAAYYDQWSLTVEQKNYAFDMFRNWREIKSLRIIPEVAEKYEKYEKRINQIGYKNDIIWTLGIIFSEFKCNILTRLSLYVLGGCFIIANTLSVGSLLMFITYYEIINQMIDGIIEADKGFLINAVATNQVFSILDSTYEKKAGVRKQKISGNIEINKLSFSYSQSDGPVLENISMTVHPGERVAIVGRSGAGKSTIIKLLLKMYPVRKNTIKVDGEDIQEINDDTLHKRIAAVMQDPYMLNLSFRDNLLLANCKADEQEMWSVLEKAYLRSFVQSLELGLDTIIGEQGIKLSGGQKQRLAIARALIADPDVIVFDEATSSLDAESEKMINRALADISSQKTMIIAAHRLSSVIGADQCYVIDNGEIVGAGTPSELHGNNRFYDALFDGQYSSE